MARCYLVVQSGSTYRVSWNEIFNRGELAVLIASPISINKMKKHNLLSSFKHIIPTYTFDLPHIIDLVDNLFINGCLKHLNISNDVLVASHGELDLELCAELREHYDMLGPKTSDISRFRDKIEMKEALIERCSEYLPRYLPFSKKEYLSNQVEYLTFIESSLSYPIFIKPVNGSGSIGTRKVATKKELCNWLNRITNDTIEYELDEFVDGTLYECDSLVRDGKILHWIVAEQLNPCASYLSENKPIATLIAPHGNTWMEEEKVQRFNEEIISAIKPLNGAVHLEFFLTSTSKIVFVEIASRCPGLFVPEMYNKSSGIDYRVEHYKLQFGMPVRIEPRHKVYCAYAFMPTTPGEILELNYPTHFHSEFLIEFNHHIGDELFAPKSITDRIMGILFWHKDYIKIREDFESLNSFQTHTSTLDSHKLEITELTSHKNQLWSEYGEMIWSGETTVEGVLYPMLPNIAVTLTLQRSVKNLSQYKVKCKDKDISKTMKLLKFLSDEETVKGFATLLPKGTFFESIVSKKNESSLTKLNPCQVDFPSVYDGSSPAIASLTEKFENQKRVFHLDSHQDQELRLSYAADPNLFLLLQGKRLDAGRLPYTISSNTHFFRYWPNRQANVYDHKREFTMSEVHILANPKLALSAFLKYLKIQVDDMRFWLSDRWLLVVDIESDFLDQNKDLIRSVISTVKHPTLIRKFENRKSYYAMKTGLMAAAGSRNIMLYNLQYDDRNAERFNISCNDGSRPIIIHGTLAGASARLLPIFIGQGISKVGPKEIHYMLAKNQVVFLIQSRDYLPTAEKMVASLNLVGLRYKFKIVQKGNLRKEIAILREKWTPYYSVIGTVEAESSTCHIQSTSDQKKMALNEFVKKYEKDYRELYQSCQKIMYRNLPYASEIKEGKKFNGNKPICVVIQNRGAFRVDWKKIYNPEKHRLYLIADHYSISILEQENRLKYFYFFCSAEKESFTFERMKDIVKNIQLENDTNIKIATMHEDDIALCAKIRESLGLDGDKLNEVMPFLDKLLMKSFVDQRYLPRYAKFSSKEYLENKESYIRHIINKLSLPLIVKPTNKAGCFQVEEIKTKEKLKEWCEEHSLSSNTYEFDELIVGDLFHCDSIVKDGRIIFSGIGRNLFPVDKVLRGECGPLCTYIFPPTEALHKKYVEFNKMILSNFPKLPNGVYHLEFFYTKSNEIKFIEVAQRPAGCLIPEMYSHFYGVDMRAAHYSLQFSLQYNLPSAYLRQKSYAGWIFFLQKKGTVTDINRSLPIKSVHQINWLIKKGDKMQNDAGTIGKYCGDLFFYNDNYHEFLVDIETLRNFEFFQVEQLEFIEMDQTTAQQTLQ